MADASSLQAAGSRAGRTGGLAVSAAPRVPPGTRATNGRLNFAIARVIGLGGGTRGAPNLFTTLGRHRRLFRPWLRFAGRLMPGGALPRADAELVILRVAHLCGSEYERTHHVRIGARAGLSRDQISALATDDPPSSAFAQRQRTIITAVDELLATRTLSDTTWSALVAAGLDERELIELPMLTGHYTMLAMTLNTLAVEPDTFRRDR
jgi:alkylhydroperoxidase family enzyme